MAFRFSAFWLAALLAASLAPAAGAATVSAQSGTVLISKGDGFVPVAAAAELAPGGRVMVQPGGLATISYAGTCTVRVGSGIWLVQQTAPCAEGTSEIDFTGRMNQQGPPAETDQLDPLLGAALVIGGGGAIVACVVWLCQGGGDHPASP